MSDDPWRWSAGIHASIATALPLAVFTLTGHQSLGLIASLDVLAIPALIAVGAFTAYSLVIALLALPPLTDKPEAEAVRLRGRFSLVWRKPESKIVAARVIAAVAASLCSSFG